MSSHSRPKLTSKVKDVLHSKPQKKPPPREEPLVALQPRRRGGRLNLVASAVSWRGDCGWRADGLPFVLHPSKRTGQI